MPAVQNDVETVLAELRAKEQEFGSSQYFANFRLHLPDPTFPPRQDMPIENGAYRDCAYLTRRLNVPFGDHSNEFSSLKRNQTRLAFYRRIDRVLREQGLLNDIKQLQGEIGELIAQKNRLFREPSEFDPLEKRVNGKVGALHSMISPVYIRLRALGYNHADLTT